MYCPKMLRVMVISMFFASNVLPMGKNPPLTSKQIMQAVNNLNSLENPENSSLLLKLLRETSATEFFDQILKNVSLVREAAKNNGRYQPLLEHCMLILAFQGREEQFKDIEIFERDDYICQLCFEPIDPFLRWPDPLAASLDHITPISKGGNHTRDNAQASHLRCNLVKGDRV